MVRSNGQSSSGTSTSRGSFHSLRANQTGTWCKSLFSNKRLLSFHSPIVLDIGERMLVDSEPTETQSRASERHDISRCLEQQIFAVEESQCSNARSSSLDGYKLNQCSTLRSTTSAWLYLRSPTHLTPLVESGSSSDLCFRLHLLFFSLQPR